MNQLELHNKIDKFLEAGVEVSDVKVAQDLIGINFDAKKYFFYKANENWLDWFLENGFLEKLKNDVEAKTKYSYDLQELEYLLKVSKILPNKVTDIILSTSISKESFNPEVIDRFLWMIEDMPVEQIERLSNKIKTERWVYLMKDFNLSVYSFSKMSKKLFDARKYSSFLEIAEAMLTVDVKPDIDLGQGLKTYGHDRPFCLHHISDEGFFEPITNLEGEYAKNALGITISIFEKIIKKLNKDDQTVFEFQDSFSFYDSDIFTIDFKSKRSISSREDFENLVVTIKKLIEKNINKDLEVDDSRKSWGIINALPENRLVWKLKMFAMSQNPGIFKEEISSKENGLFRVFEVGERYFEISGGAEYHNFLLKCFDVLDDSKKREYIQKTIKYFGEDLKDLDKMKWRKRDGREILTLVNNYLDTEEKEEINKVFDVVIEGAEYKPEPISSGGRVGSVRHRAPESLGALSIDNIIAKLKDEYKPEKISEKYKDDDFLSPRGVKGIGDELKENIKNRLDEFLPKLNKFFDRDVIAPHYVHSLLRGIDDMLRAKESFSIEQVDYILNFIDLIRESGVSRPFERVKSDSWLSDWVTVHKVIADIMLYVLEDKRIREAVQNKYREKIKDIIEYLFTINQSPSKDDEDPKYGDPMHVAINSVRGRAFEVFVVFTQNDSEELSNDIKEIFEKVLEDESLAVRSVIGRYLATFYFRDKEYISKLFPQIFPKDDPLKKDIYLATWEGYLSNTLYDKLFIALKQYYEYAVSLDPKDYTKRKYHKDLDESLAVHIALAFAQLNLEISDNLFIKFWAKNNTKRQKEFIQKIGNGFLSSKYNHKDLLADRGVKENKIFNLWDWVIDNVEDPETFSAFGSWINPDDGVLSEEKLIEKFALTLKKSGGKVDWDYGLLKRLSGFAETDKKNTLKIIRYFLIDSDGKINRERAMPTMHDNKIKLAMKYIYDNGDDEMKQNVEDLINELVEKGSSTFWGLKDIITKIEN